MNDDHNNRLVLPRWVDSLRPVVIGGLGIAPLYLLFLLYYGAAPANLHVGHQPEQPVPYSHALHAGELGIDCRYCHDTVERSSHASIPPTQTCMNCHTGIYPESRKLVPVRESYSTGMPVPWLRVHDLPDYAYFDHSAHVTRGVGCVECHGRVDKMEVVWQDKSLSMGFCLECHRNPDQRLRPIHEVTNMAWNPGADQRAAIGKQVRDTHNLNPSEDCSTCHR